MKAINPMLIPCRIGFKMRIKTFRKRLQKNRRRNFTMCSISASSRRLGADMICLAEAETNSSASSLACSTPEIKFISLSFKAF